MPESLSETTAPRRRILASYSKDAEQAPEWLRQVLKMLAETAGTSLENAGAEVIFVDAGRTTDDPVELVAGVDGVLVLGGSDVDPALYGEKPHAGELYGVDPRADAFELALTNAALDAGVPFLGICRGMQVLNVARGGTLIQDLGPDTMHSVSSDNSSMTGHDVRLRAGTLVESVYATDSLDIRSGHHQAVRTLGEGLIVSADAADGTIEAIETPGAWALGVQWHPEDLAADAQQLTTLMTAFAQECARSDARRAVAG